MGFMDKLRNKLKMGTGVLKKDVGRAADDPYLVAGGQGDRAAGVGRQVGEQAKDAGKNMRDAFE